MSSNNGKDGSPSGEKTPEKQPTPSRRYSKRQKMMPLDLTLGSSSAGGGGDGSGQYVGIPHNKRCCACEASAADARKKRARAKKAAAGASLSLAAVKSEPPPPPESICEACKAVFTPNHTCGGHRRSFDVRNLVQFHAVYYVKQERDNDEQSPQSPATLLCGPLTGLAIADSPQLARTSIPDLNLPPPPEPY